MVKGRGHSNVPASFLGIICTALPHKSQGNFYHFGSSFTPCEGMRENEKRVEVIPRFIMQKNSRPTVSRNSITCYIKAGGCPPA